MNRLLALSAIAAAAVLSTACVTIIDADSDYGWSGNGAQPFETARDECRQRAGDDEGATAFITCMADKGWSRSRD